MLEEDPSVLTPPRSRKDAIKAWETAEGKVAADSEDVRLCPISLQMPVIQKMDASAFALGAEKVQTSATVDQLDRQDHRIERHGVPDHPLARPQPAQKD